MNTLLALIALAALCLFLYGYVRLFFFWQDNRYLSNNLILLYPSVGNNMSDSEVEEAIHKDFMKRHWEEYHARRAARPQWEKDAEEAEIDKQRRHAYSPETDYYQEQRNRDQINQILGN